MNPPPGVGITDLFRAERSAMPGEPPFGEQREPGGEHRETEGETQKLPQARRERRLSEVRRVGTPRTSERRWPPGPVGFPPPGFAEGRSREVARMLVAESAAAAKMG